MCIRDRVSYPAKTTLVSLLGYNTAILYSSLFPLSLSGPSISNPPTSNSTTNHLITPLVSYVITPLGSVVRGGLSHCTGQPYIFHSYPIAADRSLPPGRDKPKDLMNSGLTCITEYPLPHSGTNYLITPLGHSYPIAAD